MNIVSSIFVNVVSAVVTILLGVLAFYIKSYFYNKTAKANLDEELARNYQILKDSLSSIDPFYSPNALVYNHISTSSWNIYKNDENNFIHLKVKAKTHYRYFYERLEVINLQNNKKSDMLFTCTLNNNINEETQTHLKNMSLTIEINIVQFVEEYEKAFNIKKEEK